MKKPVVEIFYFDAGGGHRSAMNALKDVLAEQYPLWQINPVDLQKLLEPVDPIHKITRKMTPSMQKFLHPMAPSLTQGPVQSQEIYNQALKKGTLYGLGVALTLLQLFIRSNAKDIEEILQQHWQNPLNEQPDLVVSVIPNFNRVLFNALQAVHPMVPYVTIMTDLMDCPPHFWMENQDQFMICGSENAYQQAVTSDFYDPEKIFRVSGMILKQSFYNHPTQPRLTRQQLGLSSDRPTALIMFGGNGSLASQEIVERLAEAMPAVQTIVMCGHNNELYNSLQSRPGCHVVGFVSNVADYMRLADVFIGKPGPGSISEAIHMGCPVIIESNRSTMPQERPNVDWVLENSVGVVVKSFAKEITDAVAHILKNQIIFQKNIKKNVGKNRAVFEIANLLEEIMNAAPHANIRRKSTASSEFTVPQIAIRLKKRLKARRIG